MIATWADYTAVTRDTVTPQADAEAALARAQARAEELCERLFDAASRTETLVPDADGLLWPKAYPVTAVASPATATVTPDGLAVDTGSAPFADLFEDEWGFPPSALPGQPSATQPVTLSYTGGYAPGTAPASLVESVCELASRYLAPADTRGVPAGVTSVTLGGDASQSYSGRALGGSSGIPASLRQQILRHKHVQARSAD